MNVNNYQASKDLSNILVSLDNQEKPIKLWYATTLRSIFNNVNVPAGTTNGWHAFTTTEISYLQPFGKLLLTSTGAQYASANVRIECEVNQGGSTWWAHPQAHLIYVNPYGGFDCPPITNFGFDDIRFKVYNNDSVDVTVSFIMRQH